MKVIQYMRIITNSLFVLMLLSCTGKHTETTHIQTDKSVVQITNQQSKSLGIDTVKYTVGQKELTLTGKISVDQDKVANVFPIASGNVLKVNVSLGDKVHKGEVLALLRSSEVNGFQNQYEAALSDLKLAKKNLDNSQELFKSNYYSQNQVLSAENDYKKTQTNVNMLKKQLQIYGADPDNNDSYYKILAPIDGYVVDKNIIENMQVRADNTTDLFTVSDLIDVWVMADVYETDLSKIHLGDHVDITTLAYPDKVFEGTIQKISSILDPVSKTLKLRIVLNNSDGLLKPEMFTIVKVHTSSANQFLTIPTRSLVFDNGAYTVMIAKNDTTFQKRPVKILRIEGDHTLLLDGVKVGERVVTDGSLLVSFSGQ